MVGGMDYRPPGGGGGSGGSSLPVVVDLGTIGPIFAPTVAKATTVIKGVVNEPLTMSNLTITDGVVDKLLIRIELTQGVTGGDISAWTGANFVGGDLVPLTSIGLSIGAGKTDIIVVEWDTARGKWMIVGFFNGIAP